MHLLLENKNCKWIPWYPINSGIDKHQLQKLKIRNKKSQFSPTAKKKKRKVQLNSLTFKFSGTEKKKFNKKNSIWVIAIWDFYAKKICSPHSKTKNSTDFPDTQIRQASIAFKEKEEEEAAAWTPQSAVQQTNISCKKQNKNPRKGSFQFGSWS